MVCRLHVPESIKPSLIRNFISSFIFKFFFFITLKNIIIIFAQSSISVSFKVVVLTKKGNDHHQFTYKVVDKVLLLSLKNQKKKSYCVQILRIKITSTIPCKGISNEENGIKRYETRGAEKIFSDVN